METDLETGFIVLEYDITGEWKQIGYYDELKNAWDFAFERFKEIKSYNKLDPLNVKTVTIKDIQWNDYWNIAKERFMK